MLQPPTSWVKAITSTHRRVNWMVSWGLAAIDRVGVVLEILGVSLTCTIVYHFR